MAVRAERVWWIALLLAGAMVVHLLMLTGLPGPSEGTAHAGTAHGDTGTAPGGTAAGGHGDRSAAHSAADMLSMCFAVLSVLATGLGSVLVARHQRTRYRPDDYVDRPGFRVNHATCRDGPPSPSRVDAGVLLRL